MLNDNMLDLSEIFFSIQGEGRYTGYPTLFIRLAGCNLRCKWCDTTYAYTPTQTMDLDSIIKEVETYTTRNVTITGGEPLMQEAAGALIDSLVERGYLVSIETNGSLPIHDINPKAHIIMDLKPPQLKDDNLYSNISHLKVSDEIKVVIENRDEFDWAFSIYKSLNQKCVFSVQAVQSALEERELAAWILNSGEPIKLSVQLHKICFNGDPILK